MVSGYRSLRARLYHHRVSPNQDFDDCEVRGIMISRRPNRRASTEYAPGPNSTTVAATTATKIVVRVVCGCIGVGNGNHEKATLVAPNTTSPPATGVRKPAARDAPPIAASTPSADESVVATPPRIVAIATAERSSRRPRPRLPPGYVLNNLRRSRLPLASVKK